MVHLIASINSLFWGSLLILLLVGTGIFFTIRLRFVQVRKFRKGITQLTGDFDLNGKDADHNGMSSFQALATAIAAQVGTGNLAGAATAIVSGGPGAIFWMWVSAFFGMSTIYAEAILSQLFKKKVEGEVTGGPAYYIEELFNKGILAKVLAVFFSLSCILALGFMGNGVQANSIGEAVQNAFNISPYITGAVVALLGGFVFFGGLKRIASFTEKVVPVMAGLYILICVVIIVINYANILTAFESIFVNAFSTKSILGGFLGMGVKKAIRYGVARGLFSNEAGMGSTPHAHAIAKVKNPVEQGNVALITVFIDTFVVLTLTALVILTANVGDGTLTGITLTQKSFEAALGYSGNIFIAVALFFFAFSTIIGWYFFGEAN
ncbi:MAG: sodium:alanine symporter family protein, partial [Fusobacterium periodonticum]|nr:sodium:alanine symporter family protein [Fusobacterium periodonticum]